MTHLAAWAAVGLMMVFTVYAQIMLKMRVTALGPVGGDAGQPLVVFLFRLLTDFWVWTCFASGFLAALCWMAALSRLPLSIAYPFISVTIALVMVVSALMLNEPLRWGHWAGVLLLASGLFLIARA